MGKQTNKTFPVFLLPWLAINEVLRFLSPLELLHLSMISTNTKQSVKCYTRKYPCFLSIYSKWSSGTLSFCFGYRNNSPTAYSIVDILSSSLYGRDSDKRQGRQPPTKLWKYGKRKILPVVMRLDGRHMEVSGECYGEVVYRMICDIFNIWRISFDVGRFIESARWSLENAVMDRSFRGICVDYRSILDNNAPREIFIPYQKNFQDLPLNQLGWGVTTNCLKNFLKFDEVNFLNFQLSSQEIRKFLNYWMTSLNLTRVTLVVKEGVEVTVVLKGLEAEPEMNGIIKGFEHFGIGDCISIQRQDGIKAIIWHRDGLFILKTVF